MIAVLNLAVEAVESQLATDPSTPVDVAEGGRRLSPVPRPPGQAVGRVPSLSPVRT